MKNIKNNLIIGLLVLNIVCMFILVIFKTNGLEDQLNYIQNDLMNVRNEVVNIEYSFANELEDLQEETFNLVKSFDYIYQSYDKDSKVMETQLIVELKEKQADSNIYLVLKDEEGNTQKSSLKQEDGLLFKADLALSITQEYSISVIEDLYGNLKQMNLNDYYVYAKTDFQSDPIIPFSYGHHRNDDGISFYKQFDTGYMNRFEIEGFGIESLTFVLSNNNEVIYEDNSLNQLFSSNELSEEEVSQILTGQTDISEDQYVVEDVYYDSIGNSYIFSKEMLYDDYSELKLDDTFGLDFSLVLSYTDGREVIVR